MALSRDRFKAPGTLFLQAISGSATLNECAQQCSALTFQVARHRTAGGVVLGCQSAFERIRPSARRVPWSVHTVFFGASFDVPGWLCLRLKRRSASAVENECRESCLNLAASSRLAFITRWQTR